MDGKGGKSMHDVPHWTGAEARALRLAQRMSMRSFAEHLGVSLRTIAKWEDQRSEVRLRPDSQALLDTALAKADAGVRLRFDTAVGVGGQAATACDHESWTEDLERAIAYTSRQDFDLASTMLDRWLGVHEPARLDSRGLYLYGRSLTLIGDIRRDKGAVLGPLSARNSYRAAHQTFTALGIPRRIAQIELSLAVVDEMSGALETSAASYALLSADERLSRRDRARARLWVGTALSKAGQIEEAVDAITCAAREFDDLGEAEDWSVAHQKLALAHRAAGGIGLALRHLETARSTGTTDSPLQRVRLDTAHAHILLSDTGTAQEGLSLLDRAATTALRHGLLHQLGSIDTIRRQRPEMKGA